MKLYGASGHAKVIIDILNASSREITKIFDDNKNITNLHGIDVSLPDFLDDDEFIISIGNNHIRKLVSQKLQFAKFGIAIHPSAIISPYAEIGEGSVIMQGAIIQSGAKIGKHCIINTGASVDHDCTIGDFVHISPKVALCGNVTVGDGTQIGVGSSVVPGVKIGCWSLVCAGSVVTKEIPDNCIAAGNFCKVKRFRNITQNYSSFNGF